MEAASVTAGTPASGAPGDSRSAASRRTWSRRRCSSSRSSRSGPSSTRSGCRCTSTALCRPGLSRWATFRSRQLHRGARARGVLGGDAHHASSSRSPRSSSRLLLGLAMALIMHSAFKGQGAAADRRPGAVGGAHRRHRDHVADDLRPEPGLREHVARADTVWLGEEPQALLVMIFADVWKTAPFMALLLLAGLQVIPVGDLRGRQGRRRDRVAAVPADHAAAAQARAPGRAHLPHARRAAERSTCRRCSPTARNGTETLSLIAAQDVPGEPALRGGRGLVGPDVPPRDGGLLRLHPPRGRQPQGDGGGLTWKPHPSPRHAAAGRRLKPQEAAASPPETPWWLWLAVAAIVLFCLFPFYWLLNISLKTGADLSSADVIPPNPSLDNYKSIFENWRASRGRSPTVRSSASSPRRSASSSARSPPTRWRA